MFCIDIPALFYTIQASVVVLVSVLVLVVDDKNKETWKDGDDEIGR